MRMRNIIITDGINTITSLNDLVFDIQPIEILSSVTMASGREVRDVIGYKDNLKCRFLSGKHLVPPFCPES